MTEYQRQLQQDMTDYYAFELGVAAYCRLSGVDANVALRSLSLGATPQQRARLQSKMDLVEELDKLTPVQKRKALGLEVAS